MFKKRANRPQPRQREITDGSVEEGYGNDEGNDPEDKIDLNDLLELRKFRQPRQGIDAEKLNKGEKRHKKRRAEEAVEEEEEEGSNDEERPGQRFNQPPRIVDEGDEDSKARRTVRSNNFTQQTNALDVDKHMMAYIEENLKLRRGDLVRPTHDETPKYIDPQEELFKISDKYKIQKKGSLPEGSVTNSMAMLTAIPEVDLGMDARLKNIEDTEKAKRHVAEVRQNRMWPSVNADEEHLVASRFYTPHLQQRSDAEILKNAKLEAMGLPPEQPKRHHTDRPQMATDDVVMERFKKRMRK